MHRRIGQAQGTVSLFCSIEGKNLPLKGVWQAGKFPISAFEYVYSCGLSSEIDLITQSDAYIFILYCYQRCILSGRI